MQQLCYVSAAVNPVTEQTLEELLLCSRDNNLKYDITGMLLFANNTFIQVIEGPKTNIDHLFATLQEDDRHKNVVRTYYEAISERDFPNWQMSFAHAAPETFDTLPGYSDYLSSIHSELAPTVAMGFGRAAIERFKRCFA
ncbi:hypothetical protein R50073_46540 [Maricurvus nonylphenolicus]|uniref:BLUF domain-containing protein n=1 Tax=Maricurvus nonylphenolicus TaxID=1008307 RepID=UPI0036F1CC79